MSSRELPSREYFDMFRGCFAQLLFVYGLVKEFRVLVGQLNFYQLGFEVVISIKGLTSRGRLKYRVVFDHPQSSPIISGHLGSS